MDKEKINIGVVGLGLMGCSITTCLLMAGHPVIAIAPIPVDLQFAEKRVREHLVRSREEQLIEHPPEAYLKNLTITDNYQLLSSCELVIECTLEDLVIKKTVYEKIERHIRPDALLTR